jgi:membrane protein implicated in regulation of membrane protease activity
VIFYLYKLLEYNEKTGLSKNMMTLAVAVFIGLAIVASWGIWKWANTRDQSPLFIAGLLQGILIVSVVLVAANTNQDELNKSLATLAFAAGAVLLAWLAWIGLDSRLVDAKKNKESRDTRSHVSV